MFRVTADALRVAQGTVRCGICSKSFNAIEFLSEHPVPRRSEEPQGDDTITVEELPGNEIIELSAAAEPAPDTSGQDRLLQTDMTTEPQAAGDGGDPGAAALDAAGDSELEFHGTAGELERLFVNADAESLHGRTAADDAAGPVDDTGELDGAISALADGEFSGIEVVEERLPGAQDEAVQDETDPGRVAAVLAFAGSEAKDELPGDSFAARSWDDVADGLDTTDEFPVLVLDEAGAAAEGTAGFPDGGGERDDAADETADQTLRLLIPDELRHGADSSAASAFEPEAASHGRRWPLGLAAAVLLLALLAQAANFWRDDLARNPVVGPWLIRAYDLLGLSVAMPRDLAAFELRQLGAASDGVQAGRIKLRASIVNRAPFAQPLPLLRLTLQDRFGSTIGVRDLQPGEYLPGGSVPASGLLGSSQRVDAEVVFVDPGRDAVGFELDVCLPDTAGLRCSASAG